MAKTYEPIASQNITSDTALVTFSSIPATFDDLVLIYSTTEASPTHRGMQMQLNQDTGTNYSGTVFGSNVANGSTVVSGRYSNNSTALPGRYQDIDGRQIGIMHFMSYSNTNVFKTVLNSCMNLEDPTNNNKGVWREVMLWRSTSAVNRIDLIAPSSTRFSNLSTFSLYGIKAA